MTLLAVDTIAGNCSVAVCDAGHVVACEHSAEPSRQAELLLPMVEQVLAKAQMGYAAFSVLSVTIGPGSFTGVRIGIAAMHGIALATGLPVIGVSVPDCMLWEALKLRSQTAHRAPPENGWVVVMDARRDEYYWQCFDGNGAAIGDICLGNDAAFRQMIASHPQALLVMLATEAEALSHLCAAHSVILVSVDASSLAEAAWMRYTTDASCAVAGEEIQPLYVRAPDAKKPVPFLQKQSSPQI